MESPTTSEICVFPQIYNATRNPSGTAISSNNFNLKMDILVKYSYACGDNVIEECHFNTRWGYKYQSLSWDIVNRQLSAYDFPYPLEKVKWDGVDKILKNKDELIQKILEFAHTVQNVTPSFQDDDTVFVNLIFVKHVFVFREEFKRIFVEHYKSTAKILCRKVRDKINKLGFGSSLYEEFQCLESYVKKIVRETIDWRISFDENYDRLLIEFLIEQAKKEFRSLPAVRSRMQFLQKVHLLQNESIDDCSICMGSYLSEQDAYNMPCNHSFHYDCIETWLLKNPNCPMCRFKLPSTYEVISNFL